MPVRMYWEDETKTIMRYDFHGAWTWDEFYNALNVMMLEWDGVKHRTDIIADFLQTVSVPEGWTEQMQTLADKQGPTSGLSIIVTNNPLGLMLYQVIARAHDRVAKYFRIVPTLEQARQIIAQDRRKQQTPAL
jgi:hypothetical protein